MSNSECSANLIRAATKKTVHEMSVNGDEPPPAYIVRDFAFGSPDCHLSLGEIPIIDVGHFSSSSSTDSKVLELELGKLKSALTNEGCFQAIGHGISSSLLDRIREIAKEFSKLPEEEKLKYEGYGNDGVFSEKQVLDWSYRLLLQIFPPDLRNLKLWPENPNDFREILMEYSEKIKLVMEILCKAMAKSLNLEEDSFLNQFGNEAMMNARFNFYPPCSRPDLVLGVKAHRDGSAITVLLQDRDTELEGLQFYLDDKWVKIPALPYALVVNVGGQMQIMSNGIFKSPLHRGVTNSEKVRISVAMFYNPGIEREIGPLDGLVDEEEDKPKLYKNTKNYAAFNHECYQKGIVALDTLKI